MQQYIETLANYKQVKCVLPPNSAHVQSEHLEGSSWRCRLQLRDSKITPAPLFRCLLIQYINVHNPDHLLDSYSLTISSCHNIISSKKKLSRLYLIITFVVFSIKFHTEG